MNVERKSKIESRLVEDTVGATVGAATGTGVSTLIGLALPAISSIVPWGLIAGSVAGIVFQELAQRRHRSEAKAENETSDSSTKGV
jgi:hypothetical protein